MHKPPGHAAFAFIFVTVVLDMLALGVMIPVLPKLVLQFEGGDVARAAAITGVFGFVWALMQFLFSPLLGAMSDRFGRRPIILLSNIGLGFDYILMAVAPSLAWLFVGRVLSGITAASFSAASAYVADVTAPEERAKKFGLLGAAFGLGFIVGPAFGGFLGGIDLRFPFWVAAGLSLLNAAYGFFVLPESLAPEKRVKAGWRVSSPLGALGLLRSSEGLLGLAAATFLYFLAHESLPSMFVLYADYRYHWTAATVGSVLAVVGVCSTIMSATVVGPFVKRFGERSALIVGLLAGTIGFAMYGWAPTGPWFVAAIPVVAIWGLAGPTMQSLMSARVSASDQGKMQGALASLRGISGMMGPLLFTNVFAYFISERAPVLLPGAPYLLAALLLAASMALSAYMTRVSRVG